MSEYPEHEKQAAVLEESQAIGRFLDNSPYVLCEYRKFDEYEDEQLVPVSKPINTILADYFGIDLDKIEAEKRDMLDRLREENTSGA